MPEEKKKAWFTTWFGSPYYELLYKERDRQEADMFIKNIIDFLQPSPSCIMLDIACGKGRHALSLNKMGYRVTGFDLSEANIKAAKKYQNESLDFCIHDMRKPFMVNYYDIIFNLFTSFGYFENDRENRAVLENIYNALNPQGIFVLDFVNMDKTLQCLLADDRRIIDGVEFHISRSITRHGFLEKQIFVEDGPLRYNYEERVKIFKQADLKNYVAACGFEIKNIFGDYSLNDFNPAVSDRLILIAKKKAV